MRKADQRGLLAVVAVMGVALIACGFALYGLKRTADSNAATVRQLVATVQAEQLAESRQLLLVQALQGQVRALGGEPLIAPPTPRTSPRTQAPPTAPAASARPSPAPSRSARPKPRPTPRPTPSRSPSPSATPTTSPLVCPLPVLCPPRRR